MEDKFDSIQELYENIRRGGEVEFTYDGKEYSITHSEINSEEKIYVMEQNNYDSLIIFYSADEIGKYCIGTKRLEDIVTKVQVTFRCF